MSQTSYSIHSDIIDKNSTDISMADSAFAFAKHLTFVEYEDCNNCPLRAQVMFFLFSQHYPDLKTGKVWLFAASKLSSKKEYFKTHSKKYLSHKKMCPSWGFHVAPVMIFGNDTLVIDPSTQSEPAKLSEWIKNISTGTETFVVLKKPVFYTFPEDGNKLLDDEETQWKEKNFESLRHEVDFLSEKLTLAYNNFLDPLKFNYYKKKLTGLLD